MFNNISFCLRSNKVLISLGLIFGLLISCTDKSFNPYLSIFSDFDSIFSSSENETESNDTFITANSIYTYDSYMIGTVGPGDQDYFSFDHSYAYDAVVVAFKEQSEGELEGVTIEIYDNSQSLITSENAKGDFFIKSSASLPTGTIYVRVTSSVNLNYYLMAQR